MQIIIGEFHNNGSTEEIRDLIDKIVSYMVAMNQEEMVNLFKNEHYGMGTGEDESHKTIEDVKEHWENSFTLDELHMENLLIHNIKVVEDVAWCFFNVDSKWVKDEEVVYEGKLRLSMVWEKENGIWLIS